MKLSTIILPLVPTALAVGRARIVNNCPTAVTAWGVGSSVSGPFTLNAHGGTYSEVFARDPSTGGRALKITLTPDGLYNGAPQTIFSYTLDGAQVWYDLSDVFGDAFAGKKLVEKSNDATCPQIVWPQGVSPGGSQVKVCTSEQDVTLTLCSA